MIFDQKFQLEQHDDKLQVAGIDSEGRPFMLVLDKVWAAGLCLELEDWLAGRG